MFMLVVTACFQIGPDVNCREFIRPGYQARAECVEMINPHGEIITEQAAAAGVKLLFLHLACKQADAT